MRELRNMIERACILAMGDELRVRDVMVPQPTSPSLTTSANRNPLTTWMASLPERFELRPLLDEVERELILKALAASQGRQAEAARALGVSHSDLSYKLRKHSLQKASPTEG